MLDQVEERHDREGPVPNVIGQRRQRQVDPSHLKRALWRLSAICMRNLSNRIVANNRTDEAARRGMERRRRLADLLAIRAGELFS